MVEEVNKVVKAKSSRSWGRAKVAAHVILKMGGGGGGRITAFSKRNHN